MSARKVLLLGWDAADWEIINPMLERGEMPALERLLGESVMGDISTLEPVLSPMLWNSIATGVNADRHGILGFTEPDPHTGGIRPATSTSRRVKAIWNIAAQSGLRANVVGWFASHPAETLPGGVVISDNYARNRVASDEPWPVGAREIHPPELAETFAELRLRPEEIDGEMLLMFVPEAREIEQTQDRRLFVLARLIAEMVSVHNAATLIAENREWDFLAVYHGAIDHFSHAFMKFHPPRLPWVDERPFRLYQHVMTSCYRFHDLMLARMLELAGPETAVVLLSDHGFHSGAGRRQTLPPIFAGAALDHRSHGILVLRGPELKRDERIYGAGLLDIAPTVLALLGLPPGEDMEGRVLAEAWAVPPPLARIPSWEEVPGESGQHRPGAEISTEDSAALLEQFVALGYIERPSDDPQEARAKCVREQKWNLARVHVSNGRFGEAAPLLEDIVFELPGRGDWTLMLALCHARLGLLDEAQAAVEQIVAADPEASLAQALLGQIASAKGEHDRALEHLLRARQRDPRNVELPLFVARTYLSLGRWREAEWEFQRAVEFDRMNGMCHQGLAHALLRQRRWEEAAGAALQAVSCQFHLPHAHYILGRALARLGIFDRAEQAFRTALAQSPPVWESHRWLSALLAATPGRKGEAEEHRHLAEQTQARRAAMERELQARRDEARARLRARPPRPAPVVVSPPVAAEGDGAAVASAPADALRELDLLLVSGLPRSGTSLLMQMLAAGGWPILHDSRRIADEDNPEGYFEWEQIQQLRSRPELIRQAEGKVAKVVSLLLPALPDSNRYRIIFLRRPIEQVAQSQFRMIQRRRGGDAPHAASASEHDAMIRRLRRHEEWTLTQLRSAKRVSLLEVPYPDLVANPAPWARRIAEFAGRPNPPADLVARMSAAVKPELFRHREVAPVRA